MKPGALAAEIRDKLLPTRPDLDRNWLKKMSPKNIWNRAQKTCCSFSSLQSWMYICICVTKNEACPLKPFVTKRQNKTQTQQYDWKVVLRIWKFSKQSDWAVDFGLWDYRDLNTCFGEILRVTGSWGKLFLFPGARTLKGMVKMNYLKDTNSVDQKQSWIQVQLFYPSVWGTGRGTPLPIYQTTQLQRPQITVIKTRSTPPARLKFEAGGNI